MCLVSVTLQSRPSSRLSRVVSKGLGNFLEQAKRLVKQHILSVLISIKESRSFIYSFPLHVLSAQASVSPVFSASYYDFRPN